jgi:deoxyribonuclease V
MILAVDVDYNGTCANIAGVVFSEWDSITPAAEYVVKIENIEDYIPGSFYLRELPCLAKIIEQVKENISIIVIDGYVWLNNDCKPGLGGHLFDLCKQKYQIIGVAKRSYFSSGENCIKILRGNSKVPLFITSAGIDNKTAAGLIQNMAGENRIPYLLKKVDSLCRKW